MRVAKSHNALQNTIKIANEKMHASNPMEHAIFLEINKMEISLYQKLNDTVQELRDSATRMLRNDVDAHTAWCTKMTEAVQKSHQQHVQAGTTLGQQYNPKASQQALQILQTACDAAEREMQEVIAAACPSTPLVLIDKCVVQAHIEVAGKSN